MTAYTIGVVQMDTQDDKDKNLEEACRYMDLAAGKGAKLVCFPEVMNLIGRNKGGGGGLEEIPGHTTEILMKKAREHHIYIHGGSVSEVAAGEKRSYNTTVLIDPQGQIAATYRKLHTFDITLPDGTPFRESDKVHPGEEIVVADTQLGKLGLSICYDVRFPELYRLMAMEGAEILFVPASFTMPTGKDHWEPLLRARAIENGCYVVAAGQVGTKPKYEAYGNSMVIDPWGTVIARASDRPGLVTAEIDLDYLRQVRERIPSLRNRRGDIYALNRK